MTAEAQVENVGAAHSPLAKLVVDSIRNRILTGKYAPGERLVEAHLSAELGVSRMPVREALRVLAADGFVTIEPRRGAAVAVYTPEQIHAFVEVRATLEGLNAKLAAKRHDPEEIRKLQQILAAGSRIAEKADWAQLHEANNNFLWISDKLWSSLTSEQKGWVQAAADEVAKLEPAKALELEDQSASKLKGMGVKIVPSVDKSGFVKVAAPYLEKMAKDLGPHAAKIQQTISAIK
jgi:DNA-binding transcriptional MocR family regulator